jgi:hypothetical protein
VHDTPLERATVLVLNLGAWIVTLIILGALWQWAAAYAITVGVVIVAAGAAALFR